MSLRLESNLSPASLAAYADQHGFGWRYAVATEEFLAALAALYDSRVIASPSTSHFLLSSTSSFRPLRLGINSSAEALAAETAAIMTGAVFLGRTVLGFMMLRKLVFPLMLSFLAACTAEGAARWPLTILFGGQAAAPTLEYRAEPLADLPLTDVRSGETFTLAEFAGKTVFVEPMATW